MCLCIAGFALVQLVQQRFKIHGTKDGITLEGGAAEQVRPSSKATRSESARDDYRTLHIQI